MYVLTYDACEEFSWLESYIKIEEILKKTDISIKLKKIEKKRWHPDYGSWGVEYNFLTCIRKQDEIEDVIQKLISRKEQLEQDKKEIIELIEKFDSLEQMILKKKYVEGKTLEVVANELGYSYQYIKNKHAEIRRMIKFSKKM